MANYPTPGPSSATPGDDTDWVAALLDKEIADAISENGDGEGMDLDPNFDHASQHTLEIDSDSDSGNNNNDRRDHDNHRQDDHDDYEEGAGDHNGGYHSDSNHSDELNEHRSGSFVPDEDDLAFVPNEDDLDEDDLEEFPKAEWSEDMVQTPTMQQVGICVNTVAKVIICLACSSAIKPSELNQHLRRVHKPVSVTPSFGDELTSTYDLHENPFSSPPGSIITAIYGLDLVAGYFACDTCGRAYQSEKTAKEHLTKSKRCKNYRQRFAQTFQPTSGRMYFGVELNPMVDEPEDPLDPLLYFTTNFAEPLFSDIPILPPDASRDTNHFLNEEPWLDFVKGKTGRQLNDLVRVREPELRKVVRTCVDRYTLDAIKDLKEVDHEARATIGDYLG